MFAAVILLDFLLCKAYDKDLERQRTTQTTPAIYNPEETEKSCPGEKEMPPSAKQRKVRNAFKSATICFSKQPDTDGATPPDIGPRGRDWWYSESGSLWYYNYFMQQTIPVFLSGLTPDWCITQIGGLGGVACALDEWGQDWQIDDGVELPFGSIYAGWPGESSKSRAAVSFDLTLTSSEKLDSMTQLLCTFTYNGHNSADNWTAYACKMTDTDLIEPQVFSDIPQGEILHSWAHAYGEIPISFDVLSYFKELKTNGNTNAWIGFYGSVELIGTSEYSGEIYGPDHPTKPMLFIY